jgi:chemotaxis protein methyltransferase CheR
MMLNQMPQLTGGVPVEIVATDISDRCLDRARQGLFTQFEVQRGLPIQTLMQYFTQQDDHWRISERMRQMVSFRKLNLMDPSYNLGKFDIVFCRNVLIYFDGPTKADVFERISQTMNPGGFLLLGAAESVIGITQAFESAQDRRGLYKLVSRAAKVA